MRRIHSRIVLIVLCACGSTPPQSEQSQTHWLTECRSDADCGELSCVCGSCAAYCDDDESCDVAGLATSCRARASEAAHGLCGGHDSTSAVCLVACDDGCGKDQHC